MSKTHASLRPWLALSGAALAGLSLTACPEPEPELAEATSIR